ncbi:MAG: hypothetical protein IKL76_03845 [Clostridia bacterium]|nr:hypothetical protein [Clostridia bacterium]
MKKNIKKILTTSLIASFALTTALGVSVFAMPKAEADFSDFTMDTGAGVKMDEATGIRFTANVGEKTQASLENATNIVFGTLIAPTLGSDNQLTLDDVTDANVKAKNLVTAVWTDGAESYADSETKKYNGAIVGDAEHVFPEEDYVTVLNAVGYVTYTVDDVTTTEYTTNTANRSLAQAVANSVANGVEDTSGFLEKVLGLTGVDIEKESVDMVVGGKETVATSTYTQAGIVWDSTDKNVATVENGVIMAVGKGTATVSVTLGDYTDSISVNVGDYVVGSMMMVRTVDATYGVYDGMVNGRTGVYKYTDSGVSDWNDRLSVYESAHAIVTNPEVPYPNSTSAYNGMKTKGYDYVTFDVCLTSGAFLRVDSMNARCDFRASSAVNSQTQNNENISLYSRGVAINDSEIVYANRWYTVVVDRENTQEPGSTWSFINFGGTSGTVYFDNVRYYGNKTDCDAYVLANTKDGYVEYDGSELVWGGRTSALTAEIPYGITTETVGGKTGVYKLDLTGSGGWNDKLMVYESGHTLLGADKGNLQTTFPFSATTAVDDAFRNLTNKGYNYVTIDVCFTSSSLLRCGAPQSTGTANKRDDISDGKYSIDDNDCIALYKNGVLVQLNDTIETGVWYTLVFDHASAIANRKAGQWSAMNFSGQGVTYFDKVRYYSANPFA